MSDNTPTGQSDPIAEGYRAMGVAVNTPARLIVDHMLTERGCGWDMLHRVTGVPIRHLRRWRGGEAPDSAAFARLVEFGEFLDQLDEVGYTEPTQATAFMETRITGTPGYHKRPIDLYLDGHRDLVLELAYGGDDIDREHALDRATPGWREERGDFEVEMAADGHPSLVRWRDRD